MLLHLLVESKIFIQDEKMIRHISYAFEKSINLLYCPFCGCNMELDNSQLKCETNHVFDLSKTGYVNLIRFPAKSHYNKDLFKARSTIIENGFFRALEREIENQ